jgi:hypothetical protein
MNHGDIVKGHERTIPVVVVVVVAAAAAGNGLAWALLA